VLGTEFATGWSPLHNAAACNTLAVRANGAELVGEVAQYEASTNSATCEARRTSSSRWPRNYSEAFTGFGETGGALGIEATERLLGRTSQLD
jgi:hypothetical protein